MAKQLKKFCRITKYIEKTDPKFYEILDDLCVLGVFRVRHGHSGITFIWPSKETITKLEKIRYTDDIDKGCDIVLAHIVHDFMPNAAAFKAKKADIPTGLNKKLEVKDVVGARVILADGAELELDSKFKTFSRNEDRESVWCVKKGSIDHTKHVKPASFELARHAPGAQHKRPPVSGGGSSQREILFAIAKTMANTIHAVNTDKGPQTTSAFGWLTDYYHHVEKLGHAALTTQLGIIMSPEPLSTFAFITRDDRADSTNDLKDSAVEFYSAHKGGMHTEGIVGYLKLVQTVHAKIKKTSKVTGRGRRTEFNDGLTAIITKALDECTDQLESIESASMMSAELFMNLNMSRYLEAATYQRLLSDKTLSRDDIESDLREVVEIITDRSNGNCVASKPSSQKLGPLIADLLKSVHNFATSDYIRYPLGSESVKVTDDAGKRMRGLFKDTGISSKLAELDAEQLSELFSKIGAAQDTSDDFAEDAQE